MKATHFSPLLVWSLLLTAVAGCGRSEPEITVIPDPHVQVIDLDGQKRTIPSAELYEPGTGRPLVDSVWVIDRTTNRQLFVKIDQLAATSPGHARYLPVTETPPVAPGAVDE
ncbi:hypothetical protein [Candidatus Laterigemmans baculatus]|uniref:hypothetical protein n=1 Tax=Candidatus Laterigemmans baculatus TaxID=2770505 RepID=UPI0013D9B2CC|nr:hypothetical protein [Candidatus Laterigemmans baculatus]